MCTVYTGVCAFCVRLTMPNGMYNASSEIDLQDVKRGEVGEEKRGETEWHVEFRRKKGNTQSRFLTSALQCSMNKIHSNIQRNYISLSVSSLRNASIAMQTMHILPNNTFILILPLSRSSLLILLLLSIPVRNKFWKK